MMLHWLFRRLSNRSNIAPAIPDNLTCDVPGCVAPATEQWMPSVCALREAGVVVDWVNVCAEHDVQMNEQTVRAVYGDKYNAELAAYRARRVTRSERSDG